MDQIVTTLWFNPLALGLGVMVMMSAALRHVYLFNQGAITHNVNESEWTALLVASVFGFSWLATTVYVFVNPVTYMVWLLILNLLLTWSVGRALAAIYTIRAWRRTRKLKEK